MSENGKEVSSNLQLSKADDKSLSVMNEHPVEFSLKLPHSESMIGFELRSSDKMTDSSVCNDKIENLNESSLNQCSSNSDLSPFNNYEKNLNLSERNNDENDQINSLNEASETEETTNTNIFNSEMKSFQDNSPVNDVPLLNSVTVENYEDDLTKDKTDAFQSKNLTNSLFERLDSNTEVIKNDDREKTSEDNQNKGISGGNFTLLNDCSLLDKVPKFSCGPGEEIDLDQPIVGANKLLKRFIKHAKLKTAVPNEKKNSKLRLVIHI